MSTTPRVNGHANGGGQQDTEMRLSRSQSQSHEPLVGIRSQGESRESLGDLTGCGIAGGLAMSSLYPEMRFSWEIKSVDALFAAPNAMCNGLTRLGDLSKEAILQAIRDGDLRFLQEDSNTTLLSEKKFGKECVRTVVRENRQMSSIEEFLEFFLVANDETRKNVTVLLKEAIVSSVRQKDEKLVTGILDYISNEKKIKTLTDTAELIEDSVFSAVVERSSDILNTILKWRHTNQAKKFTHKNKAYAGNQGPKTNCSAIIHAAKKNDYERLKVLFRYGYRLENKDNLTDPLKKIELFKALASPAYIIASLENSNEVSADFFCPVKKCFEFACEANLRKLSIPEYKREYEEIENRCEDYTISLLEQCENLNEVEIFLQTRNSGIKDANYILAILDSRMKFVAHERFQYVLLKKFGIGETEIDDGYDNYRNTLWIDMPWFSRLLHLLKQIPCYLLLCLYPFFYPCIYPGTSRTQCNNAPWFCKQWLVPLNRGIYTMYSYIIFITLIILYVTEPIAPTIYWIDGFLAIFIISYCLRDLGTAFFLYRLEGPGTQNGGKRWKKRYFTFWHNFDLTTDTFFLCGLICRICVYCLGTDYTMLTASTRIFWGVSFTLAIFKTIKISICSKYFGPIILSMNAMMKDVGMFIITFLIIMLAFSCGVSYMFNYMSAVYETDPELQEKAHADILARGSSTKGIFKFFFWVLLQPFRENPAYDKVTDLPYNTTCLAAIAKTGEFLDLKSIDKCKMITMYNTSCIVNKVTSTLMKLSSSEVTDCQDIRRPGENFLMGAVIPMWVAYQFLVSVVLLRILIVMMTITYRKIYENLDIQWKYARLYLALQFFDPDSLLPPPFTFLTLIMYIIRGVSASNCRRGPDGKHKKKGGPGSYNTIEIEYRSLLFNFIDNAKPIPDNLVTNMILPQTN